MNNKRRRKLLSALDKLTRLRDPVDKTEAMNILQEALSEVQKCADDEQDALDNRPEAFQFSSINDEMEENVSDLSDVCDSLEGIIDQLQDQEKFSYEDIHNDMAEIVNTIKEVIHR